MENATVAFALIALVRSLAGCHLLTEYQSSVVQARRPDVSVRDTGASDTAGSDSAAGPGPTCSATGLDPAFSGVGYRTYPFELGSTAQGHALIADKDIGPVVLTQYSSVASRQSVGFVGLNSDGSLNTGLGGSGILLHSMAGGSVGVAATQVQENHIVVGWRFSSGIQQALFAAFDSNYAPLAGFGSQGFRAIDVNGLDHRLYDVATADNVLYAVGGVGDEDSPQRRGRIISLLSDGTTNVAFGSLGIVTAAITSRFQAVAITPEGLVVAGEQNGHFGLFRYSLSGQLDLAYGQSGFAASGSLGIAWDVVIDAFGRATSVGWSSGPPDRLHLARFGVIGRLDELFQGTGGSPLAERGFALALDSQERIIAVGERQSDTGQEALVARWQTDGTLSSDFASGGVVLLGGGGARTTLRGVRIDGNGRVVATGWTDVARSSVNGIDLLVTRLCP